MEVEHNELVAVEQLPNQFDSLALETPNLQLSAIFCCLKTV